jgi:hypothetical protein
LLQVLLAEALYLALENAKTYADPPANLAYFFSQEFKEVPFVGKALAQSDLQYKGFFIHEVYFAWAFIRNMAFALLALLMLFVGIMMINRTKVNPQTVVTIQYALPKIIISIVLVAFSYPIAATMTNFFFGLSVSAPIFVSRTIALDSISNFDLSSFKSGIGSINVVSVIIYALATSFFQASFGGVFFIVWVICVVIILIQLLLLLIKWLMTYAKMVMEIVLSPIELALSALPGSEDRSGDTKVIRWFKKFLAYGLSMLVLSAMPVLVMWIGLLVLVGAVTEAVTTPVTGLDAIQMPLPSLQGVHFAVTMFFFIVIMGLSMASKLPGQIQFVLMGEAPKSRGGR